MENIYNKLDAKGGIIGGIVLPAEFEDETAGISECQKLTGWMFWEKKREPTEAEEMEHIKKTGKLYMLRGVEYIVSFTGDDGNGMLQVQAAFAYLNSTVVFFSNGTKMPIEKEDFAAFAEWFVKERNKFFVNDTAPTSENEVVSGEQNTSNTPTEGELDA